MGNPTGTKKALKILIIYICCFIFTVSGVMAGVFALRLVKGGGVSTQEKIELVLPETPFENHTHFFSQQNTHTVKTVTVKDERVIEYPQALDSSFRVEGDFNHDGKQDSIYGQVKEDDDDINRFRCNVETQHITHIFDALPEGDDVKTFAYVAKGMDEDCLVIESVTRKNVALDGDAETQDYHLYKEIFIYQVKTQKETTYEFFYNKQEEQYHLRVFGWQIVSGNSEFYEELYYRNWKNEDCVYPSWDDAINAVKTQLSAMGLAGCIEGAGAKTATIQPLYTAHTTINGQGEGTLAFYANTPAKETASVVSAASKPTNSRKPSSSHSANSGSVSHATSSQKWYYGNQTAGQLKKSIVGEWFTLMETFNADGTCYYGMDPQNKGTYEILDNKTLIVSYPWSETRYVWSNLTFEEFHKTHSYNVKFWYMDETGIWMNGTKYARDM